MTTALAAFAGFLWCFIGEWCVRDALDRDRQHMRDMKKPVLRFLVVLCAPIVACGAVIAAFVTKPKPRALDEFREEQRGEDRRDH